MDPSVNNQLRKTKIPSKNVGYTWDGSYKTIYPPPPQYSRECVSNLTYDTLPAGYPMRTTILGPTSLKHLYRGPHYYPPQKMVVPENTLYGQDTSTFDGFGNRQSYGSKLYPYHHRSPKEVREEANVMLPLPAIEGWTQYKTLSDGAWSR